MLRADRRRQARMISQNKGGGCRSSSPISRHRGEGLCIDRHGLDGFAPGDVVIMNHGLVCGQHLNNVVIYAPCFHDGKVVAFRAAAAAPTGSISAQAAGSSFGSVETTEIYQEGLQFRSLKIYEAGKRNETLWQIINDNVRFPEAALGDLRAQIAACQLGIRRYGELLARYGRDAVTAAIDAIWDNTEREARAFIAKVPDGTYEAESFLDNDGRTLDESCASRSRSSSTGCSRMVVDFSGMHRPGAGADHLGLLRGARGRARRLQVPDAAACARQRRLLPAARDRAAGGQALERQAAGRARPGEYSAVADRDRQPSSRRWRWRRRDRIPRRPTRATWAAAFVLGLPPRRPALPADEHFRRRLGRRPREDGESASVSICQGDVRNAPVELQEIQYPFLVERFALLDSGGAGRHRGGLGVEPTYRRLGKTPTNVNCERTKDPPWGLNGGGPAPSTRPCRCVIATAPSRSSSRPPGY